MRFHTTIEGGAIASFVNDQAGSGKTTTLQGAATVYGVTGGVKINDDDTKVAKGLKLGVMGNLPCTYDELESRDPEIIRQFVLMFTNAKDRDRGRPDGTLVHNRAEWQTILLLASNKPIVDLLSNIPGQSDAQAFRLLEFITVLPQEKHDRARGDVLKRQLEANAGWAGDRYLRLITEPGTNAWIKEMLPLVTDQVWKRTGLGDPFRFWVRMIASVIIAGTLVHKYHILDFSIERIAGWVMDYCQSRAGIGTVTGVKRDIEVLGEFLARHAVTDALVIRVDKQVSIPTRQPTKNLFIRLEENTGNLFILETVLRQFILERGIHRQQFEERLKADGILTAEKRRTTLGAGTSFASGQATCYMFNANHPALTGIVALVKAPIVGLSGTA